MELPVRRWHDAIRVRRSRRAFDGAPIDSERADRIRHVCASFRVSADARTELVVAPAFDVFRGLLGSYGKIHGEPAVLVFICRGGSGSALRRLGYVGEGVVLEATALGLGTCWVSGFFDPFKAARIVELASSERVVAVSPLGTPVDQPTGTERLITGLESADRRKPLEEIAPAVASWPSWARAAASAARLAPSATNRQPWRFSLEGDDLVISRNSRRDLPRTSKWLDIGIASLHAELGARMEGVAGSWLDAVDSTHDLELTRYVTTASATMAPAMAFDRARP